jgi:hypothetical protein
MEDEKIYEHPSFGMLRFSRINGRSGYLFGSEIQADNYVQLELSNGEMKRDLTDDNFYAKKNLFRVKMSPNQFAELITTLNYGSGVPCTIEYIGNDIIEQCDTIKSRKTQTQEQFKQRLADFMVEMNHQYSDVQKIISSGNISKKNEKKLTCFYEKVQQEIKSNIPFFLRCFQESMDKVVLDAKTEIDAAIKHKIVSAGIKTLEDEQINKQVK